MADQSQECSLSRAERQRNKRKFRHMMQAKVQIPTVCKQFMTNGQLKATVNQNVDRYFAWVRSQKPSAVDTSASALSPE